MADGFQNLTSEGKIAKIAQHVDKGHPVKGEWVSWLVDVFDDGRIGISDRASLDTAFSEQDPEGKLAKLKARMSDVDVPAPWVVWFLETHVDASPSPKA